MTDTTTIAQTMTRYGGSFARALAEAWFAADATNRSRIEKAFPDFFTKYAAIAESATATGEATC